MLSTYYLFIVLGVLAVVLLVEGAYPLSSLEQDFGVSFERTEAETVAGLLLERLRRIPRPGARWREGELEFVIDRATPRAIQRIRITRAAQPD